MVEYIIRLFHPQYTVATLSRGYGRITKGFKFASSSENASTLGDEPFQIFKKFGGKVKVSVGEERALAIPYIIDEVPETQLIVLDDNFQHRKVKPSFQVVLTDFQNLFYKDYLLPVGQLRESRRGVSRADAIVVTKCPFDLDEEKMMEVEKCIREYADKPIFFAGIRYGNPIALDHSYPTSNKVVLVSGIANHKPLENYVASHYTLIRHFAFADHHPYSKHDLNEIMQVARKENAMVLLTEKDAVKIDSGALKELIHGVSIFYLPIETELLKNGKEFDEMLLNVVNQHVS